MLLLLPVLQLHFCADWLPLIGAGQPIGLNTDHFRSLLIQHWEDLYMIRAEPADVIANSGLWKYFYHRNDQSPTRAPFGDP